MEEAVYFRGSSDSPTRRRQTCLEDDLQSASPDPWRPILGMYAAGDLTRYAVAYNYLCTLCSQKCKPWSVVGMDVTMDFAHDEYLASLQDIRVDTSLASTAPISFTVLEDIPELPEDNGDADAMGYSGPESQPVVRESSAGPSRTRRPLASETSRAERKDGAADRNKFIDFADSRMPGILAGWKEAGMRLSEMYFAKMELEGSVGYAVPVPEHLVAIDAAFVKTYLVFHELLFLRLDLPLEFISTLTAKEWRSVMGRGVLKRPSDTNKRGLKKWEAAQRVLEDAVAHLPNIVSNISVYRVAFSNHLLAQHRFE